MLKKLFPFNNPVGFVLTTATIILALSPEARKGTRKLLIKGAGAALALGDQMKGLTTDVRRQIGSVMNEAREEKETMVLPDFVEMARNTGNKIKNSFEAGMVVNGNSVDHVENHRNSFASADGLFEDIEPAKQFEQNSINVLNDKAILNKLNEIDKQFH